MRLRELFKRRKHPVDASTDEAFADYYVTTHGKMRKKPQDKMLKRKPANKGLGS